MTLAQPSFPTGWLAYVALVPYLIGIEGLRGKRAFGYGVVWGVLVNTLGLYWIAFGHTGGFFGALVYLGLVDGFFTLLLCRVRQNARIWLFPFIWTGFLYVKSLGEMGFPWLSLALTQTYTPAALQGAALVGAWGLDLWVAAINSMVYNGLHRLSRDNIEIRFAPFCRVFGPAAALALVVLAYGRIVLWAGGAGEAESFTALTGQAAEEKAPKWIEEGVRPLRVGLIQGSVRPDVKLAPQLLYYNLYIYGRLTRAVIAAKGEELDLIVWPETAIPQYLNRPWGARQFVQELQGEIGVPILTGAFASIPEEGRNRYYNAAFMFSDRHISSGEEIYGKRLLLPFGERVPYQQVLGFMAGWSLGWSDFSPGKGAPLMGGTGATPGVPPIGMLICYESVFARLARREVVDGAQVLAVITNDAWFGRTTGPYQHTRAATLRAVEFRRPIIRVANSGVTALIDRWGRIHRATPLYTKCAVVGQAWPERVMTPYTRMGDWLPVVALFIAAGGLFIFREPKERRTVLKPE